MRSHLRLPAILMASFLSACQAVDVDPAAGAVEAATSGTAAIDVDSLRCASVDSAGLCDLYGVSIIDLIARPAAFHGKRVRIIGYAHFEFEGNGLYLSREDWRRGILRNGLWLEPPPERPDSLNDRYVLVEATFDAMQAGHFGMWSGSLEKVVRLQSWGDSVPRSPRGFIELKPSDTGRTVP